MEFTFLGDLVTRLPKTKKCKKEIKPFLGLAVIISEKNPKHLARLKTFPLTQSVRYLLGN